MVSTLAGLTPYFSRPHCPYLTPTTRVWGAHNKLHQHIVTQIRFALFTIAYSKFEFLEAALPKVINAFTTMF